MVRSGSDVPTLGFPNKRIHDLPAKGSLKKAPHKQQYSTHFIFPTSQARAFQEVHSDPKMDRPKIRPHAWWLIRCHAQSLK
jgi:hypothetical protein